MTQINRFLLRAATTDIVVSDVVDASGMDNLFLQVSATVSVADLVATLTIRGALALSGSPPSAPVLASATKASVFPANITYTDATGVLAFASPAIGTHEMLIKIVNPPPLVVVGYDYTSGGGTVDIHVRAGGWRHN